MNNDFNLSNQGLIVMFMVFFSTVEHYFELAFPLKKSKVVSKKYYTKIKLDSSLASIWENAIYCNFLTKYLESNHPLTLSYLELKERYRSAMETANPENVLTHQR